MELYELLVISDNNLMSEGASSLLLSIFNVLISFCNLLFSSFRCSSISFFNLFISLIISFILENIIYSEM